MCSKLFWWRNAVNSSRSAATSPVDICSFKPAFVSRKHLLEAELVCCIFKLFWIGWENRRCWISLSWLFHINIKTLKTFPIRNTHQGSNRKLLAYIHPMRSCCLCSGHSQTRPLQRSHRRNASVLSWSRPWGSSVVIEPSTLLSIRSTIFLGNS